MLQFWGDTPSPTDVPSEPEGLISIAAGGYHALALRKDGTVVAWGDNGYGQCNVPRGLRGVKSISAGRDFCLALLEDGTVVAWGDNRYGQLDLPVGLNQVTAVSAGAFHGLALGADGNVTGWGGGGYRLGRADHPWHLLQFDAIAAGDGFSLGLRAVRPGPVHRHDRD
jgi:alpha-tubulin suppressor-like RCC1 family protein